MIEKAMLKAYQAGRDAATTKMKKHKGREILVACAKATTAMKHCSIKETDEEDRPSYRDALQGKDEESDDDLFESARSDDKDNDLNEESDSEEEF